MIGSPDIVCWSLTLFHAEWQDWIILLLWETFQVSNECPTLFCNFVVICNIFSQNYQKNKWADVAAWNWGYMKQIFFAFQDCFLALFLKKATTSLGFFFMEVINTPEYCLKTQENLWVIVSETKKPEWKLIIFITVHIFEAPFWKLATNVFDENLFWFSEGLQSRI